MGLPMPAGRRHRHLRSAAAAAATLQALLQGGLLPPGAAVLELGSGTGLLADKLADHLDLFVGVDASPGGKGAAEPPPLSGIVDQWRRCAGTALSSPSSADGSAVRHQPCHEVHYCAACCPLATAGMAGVFRRKIAARPDRKLHCLLGELPGALEAAGASGGQQQLPQAYDLALSHMTFHHIADVAGGWVEQC